MAGAGNLEQAALRDGLVAGIIVGKRQKAFESPEEQRGAADLAEELDGIFHMVTVRGNGARIVIEFPEQGAVGVPVGAVQGQVPRDFIGEPRISFLHTRHRGGGIWVTFGAALFRSQSREPSESQLVPCRVKCRATSSESRGLACFIRAIAAVGFG